MAAVDNTVLITVITAVGSGGLIGSLVALIKVKPEAGQILIKSAQDVVVIQQGLMTNMQQRLSTAEQERDVMKARVAELEQERDDMRHRVTELEQAVARLQNHVGD